MNKIVYDETKVRPTDGNKYNIYTKGSIRKGTVVPVVNPHGKQIGTAKCTRNYGAEGNKRAKGIFEFVLRIVGL